MRCLRKKPVNHFLMVNGLSIMVKVTGFKSLPTADFKVVKDFKILKVGSARGN